MTVISQPMEAEIWAAIHLVRDGHGAALDEQTIATLRDRGLVRGTRDELALTHAAKWRLARELTTGANATLLS